MATTTQHQNGAVEFTAPVDSNDRETHFQMKSHLVIIFRNSGTVIMRTGQQHGMYTHTKELFVLGLQQKTFDEHISYCVTAKEKNLFLSNPVTFGAISIQNISHAHLCNSEPMQSLRFMKSCILILVSILVWVLIKNKSNHAKVLYIVIL